MLWQCYDYLNIFLSVTYEEALKRRDLQESSKSDSVQHSKSRQGEFSTSSRKRRSISSSRGNSNLSISDMEVETEDETTSSFKQPLQPPSTKLIRPAKKPCVSVSTNDSDKNFVIEEENVPASRKSKCLWFYRVFLIVTSVFSNHFRPGRSENEKGEATKE